MSKARKMIPVVAIVIGLLLVTGIGGISCCNCSSWDTVTVTWSGSLPESWIGNCGGLVFISSINPGTPVEIGSSA